MKPPQRRIVPTLGQESRNARKRRFAQPENPHKSQTCVFCDCRCARQPSRLAPCGGEKMIRKTRLFTPGPTPLLPAAQFAMAAADMHHRTPEFRALFLKVLAQLKVFVGTKNDLLLLSSSGTGAMEASVSNLTSPGDRVLVLTAGKFGGRWRDLAKAFGCEVELVCAPYGQTFDLAAVKAALTPETKAVYMQAT